ncbi:MAG: hypothetical protein INR71_01665 [Terriglobus roseus]|nr:hypothetical protein [Terriglobus roseus]
MHRIDPNRIIPPHDARPRRIGELPDGNSDDLDDDELDDDEYSEEDFEDEYSEEDYDDPYPPPGPAQDLFNFGQHLTVKGSHS